MKRKLIMAALCLCAVSPYGIMLLPFSQSNAKAAAPTLGTHLGTTSNGTSIDLVKEGESRCFVAVHGDEMRMSCL